LGGAFVPGNCRFNQGHPQALDYGGQGIKNRVRNAGGIPHTSILKKKGPLERPLFNLIYECR
jgi:hypothetical protein